MGDDWERINEALGAEAQGRSLAPHVSRQTLFGIKSTIEQQMEQVAAEVARGSEASDAGSAARRELAELARRYGARLLVGRADRWYIHCARSAGYDIPAYPFSKSGELAEFLADEGVPDVPSWYARLGIEPAQYRNLAAYTVVALRAEGGWRERVVAGCAMYVDDTRFLPLCEDPFLDQAPAGVVETLLDAVQGLAA